MSLPTSVLINKKIFILTLGCKVNQYESDAMLEALLSAGAVSGNENDADICIVNTCSVTNMADRKSRQMLSRMKKENPGALIVATGCYVQALEESKRRLEKNPGASSGRSTGKEASAITADLIIGNNRKRDIVRILTEYLSGEAVQDTVVDIAHDPEFEDLKLRMPLTHTRSYIKIQDGCNSFCSYCIIPFVRGRIRNKSLCDIVREAEILAENGVRELVLTGINLSSYGDIGTDTLIDVIEAVHSIPGILRIRLSSLEPRVITDEFMQRLSRLPKLCPHFHLSLQSCCDSVLKRMNRKYTVDDINAIVKRIRGVYDRPALTADIITGFPGETDEEFEITLKNLEQLQLYEMHVFKYSRRKGTVADTMPGQIPEPVKNLRSEKLISLGKEMKKNFEASFSKDTLNVLIEEIVDTPAGKCYRGHTERYLLVDIPVESIGDSSPDMGRINTIISVSSS